MTGHVDSQGRALLEVRLRPLSGGHPVDVAVWIDTAFTGELVLPRSLITSLALPISSAVRAVLADGS